MLSVLNKRAILEKEFTIYGDFENPLFLARDVAEWIEYDMNKVGQMLQSVDEGEKLTTTMYRSGQNREMWFLTEDGLYEVLMQSRKPVAKEFKKQVKAILKELRTKGRVTNSQLSPQLQLLIDMELEQKRQASALEATNHRLDSTNHRLDSIKEVVALSHTSWRKDATSIIAKIAKAMGGFEYIKEINAEIYTLLQERASVSLSTRLTNKRRRMAEEGVCKSKRDKQSKVDIIAEDKKLIEIYLAIVKELAVKYDVDVAVAVAV